jgi:two-component sensor histidine kinase
MSTDTLTMTAVTPQSIGAARHVLQAQLDAWSWDRTADALLVFSELVTNAVKHAGGARRIEVVHGHRMLRLEIHDDSHDAPAIAPFAGADGGFGLRIVDQLSQNWGWMATATGKVVWAALECCADTEP